jgi:hypothetical protein
MTLQSIRARVERLDALTRGLAKETVTGPSAAA